MYSGGVVEGIFGVGAVNNLDGSLAIVVCTHVRHWGARVRLAVGIRCSKERKNTTAHGTGWLLRLLDRVACNTTHYTWAPEG